MKKFHLFLILFAGIILNNFTNKVSAQGNTPSELKPISEEVLKVDPEVTIGKLDNGLTYYIRKNMKPEKLCELRLVIKTGSVYEENDQAGLAHFIEHMAFRGTKNFSKKAIGSFLKSLKMKSGPDLNAYCSFEETAYLLQIPTDNTLKLDTAFQILEDWAHDISFEVGEISREKGAIVQEGRFGRGPEDRMRNKQFPILFKGSRFEDRLPIGKREIIEKISRPALLRFYTEWYRPELMAVIAVGDFDKTGIKELIEKHFSHLSNPKKPRKRPVFPAPNHTETLFAIASDKDASFSWVEIYNKYNFRTLKFVNDFRGEIVEKLFHGMLSDRLKELIDDDQDPFQTVYSYKHRLLESNSYYILGANNIKDSRIDRCLDILLTEYKRVQKFGFTKTEMEKQKTKIMKNVENNFNDRNKTESFRFINALTGNFLKDEPVQGIESVFELHKSLIPGIRLEEINALSGKFMNDSNRVIFVNLPEKNGIKIPTEKDLFAVIKSVENKEVSPYVEKILNPELIDIQPQPSSVVNEKKIKEIGVTEWNLKNGVRVVLKPTDFGNEEILLNAFSPGGLSLVSNKEFLSGTLAADIIEQSGLAQFSAKELQKMLKGNKASVHPFIGQLYGGFDGNCSTQDAEKMFQLIYLYFTSPRKDSAIYFTYKTRLHSWLKDKKDAPENAFYDSVNVTLTQHNFRALPFTPERIEEIDMQTVFNIYRDRFADAGNFTFILVGKFELDKIKPLIEKYLGGLPSLNRKETWKDPGLRLPKGVIEKVIKKGSEKKSKLRIVFSGPFESSAKNQYEFTALREILNTKMQEVLHLENNNINEANIWGSTELYPTPSYTFNFDFSCAPNNVEKISKAIFQEIDTLKNFDLPAFYIEKTKINQKKDYEINLIRNKYWLNSLFNCYYYNDDPLSILEYSKLVDNLSASAIQKAARKYFDLNNYVKVSLFPEK